MQTNMVASLHNNCPCNYNGSPGAMEYDEMMYLMKRLYTIIERSVYFSHIMSDDDNYMKKYITCPSKRPAGKKYWRAVTFLYS